MAPRITVSLTSIPARFADLPERLDAILRQDPDRLCLTIPDRYQRFPDWDEAMPDIPAGVTLLRGTDHGPGTKTLAAARAYPADWLLVCDDDCTYAPPWLEVFRHAFATDPTAVHAASTFEAARLGLPPGHVIAQGFAGILFHPKWLTPLSPGNAQWVDDIWLSASFAAASVPIRLSAEARRHVVPDRAVGSLQDAVIKGCSRADLNRMVARELAQSLGIWR